jgi:hypothetical protein
MEYTRPTPDRFDTLRNWLQEWAAAERVSPRVDLHCSRSRRLTAERLSGIGIVYPRGSRRRRMHDIECDGTRLYEVLRSARFVVVTAPATDSIAVDWHGPRACHRWPRNCRRSRLAGVGNGPRTTALSGERFRL